MSGKHRWRRQNKKLGRIRLADVLFPNLTQEEIDKLTAPMYGPTPEANHKAGLPAFLYGLPVVVED